MMIFIWSVISIALFIFSLKIINITKNKLLNPVLITILLLILVLVLTKTNYIDYKQSTEWITFLLGPIVVMLAVPLYKSSSNLKENLFPIMAGIIGSVFGSIFSVVLLCKLFKLDVNIMKAMVSKSITTPMAIEITDMLGGVSGLTVIFVITTGIIGSTLASWTLSIFKINNPIAKGVGIGASSHGIGTAKAVEISSEVAAASGLAMGIAGVTTVLTFSILSRFFNM